ncbi:porin [Bradyrhizobium neotropicale]|uniref:porin n=1 Tax=Bradyrhizobium neotropicale TaxID=1497615 RepID=UPI001AD72DAB|nr:porin [Bradyrhizobium neotropicale]MBO4227190.1 porin [Bradyrhizobium neotropicale]
MTVVRTFVLGGAASLITLAGAQAADLPVKAKAVEYVKVCSLYGAGFWYIPGTDTCMKIGGYLRVDATFNGGIHGTPAWNGDIGQGNRYRDYFAARSRMALTIDTRTATEYGVVRTFGQADFQFSTLGGSTYNPNSINTGLPVAGSQLLDTPGGGYVAVEYVFIQFAGFTFGKSASAYATPWQGFPGNINSNLLGGQNTDTGVNNIQYTAQFGNGVSASIGLDDPTVWDRTAVYNLSLPLNATFNTGNAYAGVHAPDVVGNIRIDQAWGLFQISAAAHEVSGSYNTLNVAGAPAGGVGLPGAAPTAASELSGHPDTKWGGAAMIGVNIKNIPTGPGDDIKFDVSYAKGATKYVISSSSASPSFAMFGSSGAFGAYQSIGFGATTDGVYLPVAAGGDGSLHLTEAFGIRGAFNHNWDPYWSTSLFGSYSAVRYDGAAKAFMCLNYTTPAKAVSADFVCNPNFNVSQLGAVTRWTPVKNLTFSAEFQWFHLDQSFQGTAVLGPSAPKPAARYEFKDQDTFLLQLRAQRNF